MPAPCAKVYHAVVKNMGWMPVQTISTYFASVLSTVSPLNWARPPEGGRMFRTPVAVEVAFVKMEVMIVAVWAVNVAEPALP